MTDYVLSTLSQSPYPRARSPEAPLILWKTLIEQLECGTSVLRCLLRSHIAHVVSIVGLRLARGTLGGEDLTTLLSNVCGPVVTMRRSIDAYIGASCMLIM